MAEKDSRLRYLCRRRKSRRAAETYYMARVLLEWGAMSQNVRTFVAVEASPAVRQRAAEMIRQLAPLATGIKWVEPQNLHITVKFLGDVTTERLPEVCQAVQKAAAGVATFEFDVFGAGAFPRVDRPRTIWLGNRRGEAEMAQLSRKIETALEKLGFPREGRRFQAHLTIGRVRQGGPGLAEFARRLREMQQVEVGSFAVDEVVVFSSQLGPQGPTYTPLARGALGAGATAKNGGQEMKDERS